MTTTHINRLRCSIANTPGLAGNVVVCAATSAARRTFTAAEDGKSFEPTFEDGTAWETRTGCVYTHATSTLTRGTLVDSSTGSAIALTSATVVGLHVTAKAMQDLEPARRIINSNYSTNLFIGSGAGSAALAGYSPSPPHDGDGLVFVGVNAGRNNTSGFATTNIGVSAGGNTTTGDSNVNIGYQTGLGGTTAKWNVNIGVDNGASNVYGWNSVFIGHHTASTVAYADATGESVIIGAEANNGGVGAIQSTLIGYRSGFNLAAGGLQSSFYGYLSGFSVTSGASNSYFGWSCGRNTTTGDTNSFFGRSAGYNINTGYNNCGLGAYALFSTQGSGFNSAFGAFAGYGCVSGASNVFFGYKAGYYETGSNKLFVDNQSRANEADGRVKALLYGIFDAAVANQALVVNGKFAVNGATPQASAAVSAASTDLATVVALCNQLRAALIANGMCV